MFLIRTTIIIIIILIIIIIIIIHLSGIKSSQSTLTT